MVVNGFKYNEFLNELNAMSNLGSEVTSSASDHNGFKYDDFLNATGNLGSQVPPPASEQNGFKYGDFLNDLDAPSNMGPQVPPPASDQNRPRAYKIDNTVSNINAARYLSGDTEIFSDIVLGSISRMLMEEDVDEKLDMFQDYPALLEAAEKPFYEILVPSPDRPDSNHSSASSDGTGSSNDTRINNGAFDCNLASVRYPSRPSCSSTGNDASNTFDHSDMFSENMFAFQFRRGVEEARKFLPRDDNLVVNLEGNRSLLLRAKRKETNLAKAKVKAEERDYSTTYGSFNRKTRRSDELDSEERRNTKQSAVYQTEETLHSEMSDMVLLCPGESCDKGVSALREAVQNKSIQCSANGHFMGKVLWMYEPVDLQALLISCAQAVSVDDRRTANELLKQVRHHSTPFGGAAQRLANYFADGLEARLVGTGSDKYHSTVSKHVTSTDILKGRWLRMTSCPYQRTSHYFIVQTIVDATVTASVVHVVDFGIYFGFQWPSLIQRLSKRPGGPPRLRITGIDFPQPGFRPAAKLQEKGRRLAEYARVFGVPFEYRAIAAQWEAIKPEDLKIVKDEVLVVSCVYRFKNLLDETVVVDCPRNKVLNTIRRMNPKVFVEGVVNGSYSVPFFVTRFREALFHFSALFDLLETNIPREEDHRMLLERDIFGRDVLNVIACEGSERVERPESYKKWQVRNHKAGFVQLPLDPQIMKKITDTVREHYHKDFVIDRDGQWLLQGWKGRIFYALSVWKPNDV